MQVPFEQHPSAQLVELHPALWQLWLLHVCEGPHAPHAVPPVPQAALVFPATHCPFWQQPYGQVEGLQGPAVRHSPPMQAPPPHSRHCRPPAPHAVSAVPPWHTPF
jgi:hypothetical protein